MRAVVETVTDRVKALYGRFASSPFAAQCMEAAHRMRGSANGAYSRTFVLWEQHAPQRLQRAASNAWEAVASLDCGEEVLPVSEEPVRRGDKVVVKADFEVNGRLFGQSSIRKGARGTVEAMVDRGGAIMSFQGYMGKFHVSESQLAYLQVESKKTAPTSRMARWRTKVATWLSSHWQLTFFISMVSITTIMVLLLIPTPHPTSATPATSTTHADGTCTAEYQDCRAVRACCNEYLRCFERDAGMAMCMSSCVSGVHHGEQGQTSWTCRVLEAEDTPGGFRKLQKREEVLRD